MKHARALVPRSAILVLGLVPLGASVATACGSGGGWNQEPAPVAQLGADEFPGPPLRARRGVGWWPSNLSPDRCFETLREGAEMVYLQRHAFAPDDLQTRAQDRWLERAGQAGLAKFLAIEPFSSGGRRTLYTPSDWSGEAAWSNAAWRAAYREHLVALAERHRPEYFCIAVEANMYYSHEPQDYEAFRSAFPELRRAIEGVSPVTAVFASYQYEILTGQADYWVSDDPQFELLGEKALDQAILGISTYPIFLEKPYDPRRIPDDYYAVLHERSKKPVFFAEIGFYSGGDVSPPGSESGQALFIRRLRTLLAEIEVEGLCWINLTDMPATEQNKKAFAHAPQFMSLALLHPDLSPKRAWREWVSLPEARFSEEAMAKARAASAGRSAGGEGERPTSAASLELGKFLGLGSTESAEIVDDGELRWSYAFEKNPMSMLLFQRPPALAADFAGLELELHSKKDTTLVILLNEEGGAQYERRLEIEGGTWQTVRADRGDFKVQPNTPDGNDRLDPGEVHQIPFIDFSGFQGKRGTNELRFRRIVIR